MERMVQSGEFYRHFKNKLYQIITVALHSETLESMVVYQALYGDYRTYVRPLAMFLSEVDHEKYPGCTQQYRFERVEMEKPVALSSQEEVSANAHLLRFLDADTIGEQLAVLNTMKGHVEAKEIESICLSLDITYQPGGIDEQIDEIRRTLRTRQRYDGSRLRSQEYYGRTGGNGV